MEEKLKILGKRQKELLQRQNTYAGLFFFLIGLAMVIQASPIPKAVAAIIGGIFIGTGFYFLVMKVLVKKE